MKKAMTMTLLLLAFIGSASYWLARDAWQNRTSTHVPSHLNSESTQPILLPDTNPETNISESSKDWFSQVSNALTTALEQGLFDQAQQIFDRAYAQLTSNQVDELADQVHTKSEELILEGTPKQAIRLLDNFAESYNMRRSWQLLAIAYQAIEQWEDVLHSVIRSNRLEVDPQTYQENLRALEIAASKINTAHQRNQNVLASLQLYQQLYSEYPQHPRFQFDLARAYLAAGSETEARDLLSQLIYDPQLGSLAQRQLDVLDQASSSVAQNGNANGFDRQPLPGQLMVPLQRAGSGFMVSSNINGNQTRLLLDTGASITALSQRRIEQLGLQPLNKNIRLSTANGITQAALYQADRVSFGQVHLRNLVVAALDLPSDAGFDGLLGTDVLTRLSGNYSYVLDDERSALVFSPR